MTTEIDEASRSANFYRALEFHVFFISKKLIEIVEEFVEEIVWRNCGKMLQLAARLPFAHHLSRRQWHSSQLPHATPAAFASLAMSFPSAGKIPRKFSANQRKLCFCVFCLIEFAFFFRYEVLQVYSNYLSAAGRLPARVKLELNTGNCEKSFRTWDIYQTS